MYDLKRMLVCLDQSEIDQTLIKAAAEYGNLGQATDIYFVTVVKSLELPDDLKEEFPDLQKPLDEKIEQQMRERINEAFTGVNCRFHFDVLEGDPTKQIIHWSRVKEADLIIVGKKKFHLGKGLVSRNIVNLVHCSVLFVTQEARLRPAHILLPIDFSEVSHLAYQEAVRIGKAVQARITCLHIYSVPTGYHTTGKTYEEFAEIMLHNARNYYKDFLSTEEEYPGLQVEFVLDKHNDPDKAIAKFAAAGPYDLIVLGSKGRTALSSVLLGSVAAKLIKEDLEMPVLVVKPKDHNMGLVEAILQL